MQCRLLCVIRLGIDPYCFDLGLEQNNKVFQSSQAYKKSTLGRKKEKNGNVLQTGTRMRFTKKEGFGVRCTLILFSMLYQ